MKILTLRLILRILLRYFVESLSLLRDSYKKKCGFYDRQWTWIFCKASVAFECFSHKICRTLTAVAAFKPPFPWASWLETFRWIEYIRHLGLPFICLSLSLLVASFLVRRTRRLFRHLLLPVEPVNKSRGNNEKPIKRSVLLTTCLGRDRVRSS